ncbi:MAG TPA: hypothetical protein VKB19_06985 [Pedobacter sp.]|nr:hypothetical protein [Pedobacter sp.]
MKIRNFFFITTACILMACGSQETADTSDTDTGFRESENVADTIADTSANATGSMSGSNGTGTDTTDMKRQKATRQKGQ